MTIDEITCTAPGCPHKFMTIDRPAASVAPDFGWVVGDPTLCPRHATEGADRVVAAMEAAGYGRHHRDDDQQSDAEYWGADAEYTSAYPHFPFRFVHQGAHRLTDTRRMTVAELREAIHA